MKKLLTVSLVLMLIACTFTLISCNSDEEPVYITEASQINFNKFDNNTLLELKEFNSTIQRDVTTRGMGSLFRNFIKFVSADVTGAGKALKSNYQILSLATTLDHSIGAACTGVVAIYGAVKGSFFSKKRSDENGLVNITDDEMYSTTISHLLDHAEERYGTLVLVPTGLNLYADSISVPSSFSYLEPIGQFHNQILSLVITEDAGGNNTNGQPNEDPIGDGDFTGLVGDMQTVFSSSTTESGCNLAVADVVSYCTSTGFDYEDNLTDYPFTSNNVNSTYLLFLSALESAQSVSDVISIVNSYISIIEANNDFTADEKEQIYGGMIVAVYSYDFWEKRELVPLGPLF